jgi:hypothetical protein
MPVLAPAAVGFAVALEAVHDEAGARDADPGRRGQRRRGRGHGRAAGPPGGVVRAGGATAAAPAAASSSASPAASSSSTAAAAATTAPAVAPAAAVGRIMLRPGFCPRCRGLLLVSPLLKLPVRGVVPGLVASRAGKHRCHSRGGARGVPQSSGPPPGPRPASTAAAAPAPDPSPAAASPVYRGGSLRGTKSGGWSGGGSGRGDRIIAASGNRRQQPLTRAQRRHPQRPEVRVREATQRREGEARADRRLRRRTVVHGVQPRRHVVPLPLAALAPHPAQRLRPSAVPTTAAGPALGLPNAKMSPRRHRPLRSAAAAAAGVSPAAAPDVFPEAALAPGAYTRSRQSST